MITPSEMEALLLLHEGSLRGQLSPMEQRELKRLKAEATRPGIPMVEQRQPLSSSQQQDLMDALREALGQQPGQDQTPHS